jgi:hypothetical protein
MMTLRTCLSKETMIARPPSNTKRRWTMLGISRFCFRGYCHIDISTSACASSKYEGGIVVPFVHNIFV